MIAVAMAKDWNLSMAENVFDADMVEDSSGKKRVECLLAR